MIRNYIKIAWRNLFKHKIDSAISIGGLAVGISCCILLVAFVRFEWSFDNFHENGDRIYRVVANHQQGDEVMQSGITPAPIPSALKSNYPEVESAIKMVTGNPVQVRVDDKYFPDVTAIAGKDFFRIFSFELLKGKTADPLSNRTDIVLTKEKARSLFGHTEVIGETIQMLIDDREMSFSVSAVAETPPSNSSIQFEIVIPWESQENETGARAWAQGSGETWIQLAQVGSIEALNEKLPVFVQNHYGGRAGGIELWLQSIDGVYFNQEVYSVLPQSNKSYSLVLAGIALVVLLIACINFVSLTIGRSSMRSHEISIRKVAGARKSQLVGQFLGEVFVTCSLAFIVALILAEMLIPFFRNMVEQPISLNLVGDPVLLLLVLGILGAATLVTGLYPSLLLSSKNITSAFKSATVSQGTSPFIKSLIVVQFSLTIAFIAIAFLMQQQLQFLFKKDLGYEPENALVIDVGGMGNAERGAALYRAFGEQARRLTNVQAVSGSSSSFMIYEWKTGFTASMAGITTDQYQGTVHVDYADEHLIDALGFELVRGRNYSSDRPSDFQQGMIVNERMVELMGWENPIGQTIDDKWGNFKGQEVIGVVANYHDESLYHNLKPLVISHRESSSYAGVNSIIVRFEDGSLGSTLQLLQNKWQEVLPGETFNYSFLDDYVRRQYAEEQRWSQIMKASSATSILLACFGLFGLAALAAQRRTKEIGIRKVLGATVENIVGLLSRDFVKLVLIGFVIAIPLAYYAMNRWLADFEYKIEIGPEIFAVAGAAALLIALATVSWQSVRAALANPVDSLRSE